MNIEDTLKERGKTYGSFADNAKVAQNIKDAIRQSPNWDFMKSNQKEALEIIASKISRILTGNYNHKDSWHDIAGYAKLVENELDNQDQKMNLGETNVDNNNNR